MIFVAAPAVIEKWQDRKSSMISRTREENEKGNQMKALRLSTGERHQTLLASLQGHARGRSTCCIIIITIITLYTYVTITHTFHCLLVIHICLLLFLRGNSLFGWLYMLEGGRGGCNTENPDNPQHTEPWQSSAHSTLTILRITLTDSSYTAQIFLQNKNCMH